MYIVLHFCVVLHGMYFTNSGAAGQTFLTLPIKLEKPHTFFSVPVQKNILLIVQVNI